MTIRIPTREELKAALDIEGIETAVAEEKLARTKQRARDPLVTPDAPAADFTFEDMLALKVPEEPEKPKEPSFAQKVAEALPKGTQLGVAELLEERPELRKEMTDTQKTILRIGTETAAGAYAGWRFGPPGAGVGATAGFVRALPPAGRALAVAFPRTARALQVGPIVGGGEAIGSLISETFDPQPGSAVGRAVTAFAFGATAEGFVPGFARAGEKLRRGGYKLNKGAREVVEKLMREDQAISPGFFSDNFAIQVLDNVSSGSMFGGGTMRRAQIGGTIVMQDAAEDFVRAFRAFAADSTDVQLMTRQLLEGRADAWRLVAKKKFGIIDELTREGARVDVSPLDSSLNKVLKEAGGESAARPLLKELERLREVGSILPDGTMTFEGAADLRSFMLRLQRAGPDQLIPGKMKKIGADLAKDIDRQMEKAFRGLLPQSGLPADGLKRAWREANQFWRTGLEDFNSTLIKSLTKAEPRQVALAIRSNTGNIKRLKRLLLEGAPGVRGADEVLTEGGLTGRQVWNEIQGEILNDMAVKSETTVADLSVFSGSKMLRKLRTNKEQMTELLGQEGYGNALKIFRQVELAQGSAVEKNLPGKVFITFKQAGAISEVGGMVMGVGQGISPEAVALLAGPATLARLLTSKSFTKWALLGLDPKTPAVKSTRAITQMFAMALKEGATPTEVEQPEKTERLQGPLPAFLTGPHSP